MAITLSADDRDRVRAAIAAAETKTAGEIFTVVAHQSDTYHAVPLLWALGLGLATPLPLLYLTRLPATTIYAAELAVFILAALLLSLPAIRPLVVPRAVKHARAHQLAVEQFLAHGLHMTEARTGVLVFVSLAERYVEIIADRGIAERVGQSVWDGARDGLLAELSRDRLADGLCAAVAAVGAVLAAHFPPEALDRNELADDLVIL
jgi:putative membrane protein